MFLARATQEDLEIAQFDVCTAFLYGELEEKVFMKIPEGLLIDGKNCDSDRFVCCLNKSLYGLKQAPRCWNLKFNSFMKKFHLVQSEADQCIYHGEVGSVQVYMALFVDDGLIACKSSSVIESIISYLREAFEITRGDASRFVGLQIVRDRNEKTMLVHQTDYVNKILKKFKMSDTKPVSVPADPHAALSPVQCESEIDNSSPYREAVGSLMFLAVVSRPDIAYAVNTVSKFLNKQRNTLESSKTYFCIY